MGVFSQLKQIKDLKKQAKGMQDQLKDIEETVEAGWSDKVAVTMNGNQEITKVKIDEGLLDPKHQEKVQDLIIEAINKANKKIKKIMAEQMMKQEGGMMGMLNKLKDVEQNSK
jgi:DNA-binding YbaB/EbfC family protein